MKIHKLLEVDEKNMNKNVSPNRKIHVENKFDLELFPSYIRWCNGYPSKLNWKENWHIVNNCLTGDHCWSINRQARETERFWDCIIYECNSYCKWQHVHSSSFREANSAVFTLSRQKVNVGTLESIKKRTHTSEYCGELITN